MIKTRIKQGVRSALAGRTTLQPLYQTLHRLALIGMHYGAGSADVEQSGETYVIRYLAQRTTERKKPVVFDVGANIGDYTSALLSVFHKDVDVHCFEPSKHAFAALSQRVAAFDNVHAYNIGFSEAPETATLYANRPGSEYASVHMRRMEHVGLAIDHTEAIILQRLDDFCHDKGISHIDLLKIDVEGNELRVLKGSHALMTAGAIDLIQFEFGGASIDARVYLKDFFSLLNKQYRIHRVLADGLAPIDTYQERIEIFMTTNYLAVRRRI